MKKKISSTIVMIVLCAGAFAQESNWSASADFVSSYVWRGLYLSNPSIQPTVSYSSGGFTMGVWGSAGFDGYLETDLFASYGFDFGLSLGLTDYYIPSIQPDPDVFDFSKETGAHALEINAGYAVGGLSLSANYILNEAGGIASMGGDKYFQIGYDYGNVGVFVGGGDGWHSLSTKFNVTNIGLSVTKEIPITSSFSIPLKGSVILNPNTEKFYVVAGITL